MKSLKLSILVLSTHTRRNTFLPKSLDMIYGQLEKSIYKDDVEVLYLIDNRCMTIGDKRNRLKAIAKGKYVVFVDDDDRIANDYIDELVKATEFDKDVIVFNSEVKEKGIIIPAYSSKNFKTNFDFKNGYYRIPNCRMCIKRNLTDQILFKNISHGEDTQFGLDIKKLIHTEYFIDKILYFYDYDVETSEAPAI